MKSLLITILLLYIIQGSPLPCFSFGQSHRSPVTGSGHLHSHPIGHGMRPLAPAGRLGSFRHEAVGRFPGSKHGFTHGHRISHHEHSGRHGFNHGQGHTYRHSIRHN